MTDEIELKFIVKDYKLNVEKILSICNFINSCHELTIMYDDKEKNLFKEDARLRLRRIKDLKTGEETCELSLKKPKTREGIKIEEENEVIVSNFEETEIILRKIGFERVSSYERVRDTFKKDGCKITLDSFSFANILEIEGSEIRIKKIAKELGLDLKENITKSCDDIYADFCKEKEEKIEDNILLDKLLLSKFIEERKFLLK
jgi:adenylate cyclase class IV